jgi:hypothetical protein
MGGEPAQISVKEAVTAAARYFTDVTGYTQGVTVEEVELAEDKTYWLVTLGYLAPQRGGSPLVTLYAPPEVQYKLFKVDAKTGEVTSMKTRKL